ncbi:branched-chain amino acid ABC transporter permease [Propylenella binzhouense]|uniref:Branched-chain amino acid ABC transporter permease n=1 Tax=Propylenella binzhouense TaxID=2555902 RepID=A0A964T6D1_9HYPH|nr:branched-chain amino acid ABC transporter permease [Propylenella binzhouense]MYZ48237.1 branched-chain amino acid ABC transporter permease [Propylenella binzhouense]
MPAEIAYFLQQAWNGVQVSAFYALLAVGYVLVHAVTNRTNLAFGAIAIWGGQSAAVSAAMLGTAFWLRDAPALAIGVVLALCATALLSVVLARLVVVPLVDGSRLSMLVATIGVAIVIEEAARFASDGREVWLQPVLAIPLTLLSGPFPVGVTAMQFVNLACAGALIVALAAVLARHPVGRAWRAVADDAGMARLVGVDTRRIIAGSMLFGGVYAGAAGILAALNYGNVSFYQGLMLGLKVLYVVVLGGFRSVPATVAGAGLLGFAETLWSAYLPIAWRDVATFGALTLLLALKPAGLFAGPERIDHAR